MIPKVIYITEFENYILCSPRRLHVPLFVTVVSPLKLHDVNNKDEVYTCYT